MDVPEEPLGIEPTILGTVHAAFQVVVLDCRSNPSFVSMQHPESPAEFRELPPDLSAISWGSQSSAPSSRGDAGTEYNKKWSETGTYMDTSSGNANRHKHGIGGDESESEQEGAEGSVEHDDIEEHIEHVFEMV